MPEQFKRVRRRKRMLQGAALGLGAPLGWFAVSSYAGCGPGEGCTFLLYAYMTVGTALAFAAFGFLIGAKEQRFEELSLIDPLTGLCNRRNFHERLRKEFANAQRYHSGLALLALDLDHFKRVNDTYGHQVGDKVLKATARAIMDTVREGDTAARIGGEEMAVILPGAKPEGAVVLAERIREAIKAARVKVRPGVEIQVKVSIGVAGLGIAPVADPDHFSAMADAALYRAKGTGRDRVVLADENDAVPAQGACEVPKAVQPKAVQPKPVQKGPL